MVDLANPEQDKETVQAFLNGHKGMNEGHGLIVSKGQAQRLRDMGIDGPFYEVGYIPVSGAAQDGGQDDS